MTRLAVLLSSLCVVLCGCVINQGTGHVVTEQRNVSGFRRVSIAAGMQATVLVGQDYSVALTTDDNLQDVIETTVDGDTLHVGPKKGQGVSGSTELKVDVTLPDLTALSASGGSRVCATGVDTRAVDVEASGGSLVTLSGRAGAVTVNASGGSKLDARQFEASSAEVNASGGSHLELRVSDSIDVDASGGSQVFVHGQPRCERSELSGGSDLHFNRD